MYRITPNFKSGVTRKPKVFLDDGSRILIAGRNVTFLSDEIYEHNKELLAKFPLTIEKMADVNTVLVLSAPEPVFSEPIIVVEEPVAIVPVIVVESPVEPSAQSLPEEVVEESKKVRRPRKTADE